MINCEQLWDTIISKLSSTNEELQTTTGLWFKAYVKNGRLFVDGASDHSPSSRITKTRSITKNDFLMVQSYYDRWFNGETGIRHEICRKSKNTAYIFALIDCYK
jgi:hypothetical protein